MAKYNHIENIPARVFFKILETNDLTLLQPDTADENLNDVFVPIYDDYFIKSDNYESRRYLELTKEIAFLEYKINVIKEVIRLIVFTKTTKKMRLDLIQALKEGCKIYIDEKAPFVDEMERVLQVEIGIIQNDLNFAKLELENMSSKSQSKDYDYYDKIGVLSNVLQGNSLLREDMSLAVYIALEKLANKIVKEHQKV